MRDVVIVFVHLIVTPGPTGKAGWTLFRGRRIRASPRKVKILEGVEERRVLWTLDMKENPWARLLAYVTGLINQELLLKNEYLAAENRILRAHLPARLR